MESPGRDFKRDYDAAVAAEESARGRLTEASGWTSKLALRTLVIYRRLDTAILRDLAKIPRVEEQGELEYDEA